MKEKKIGIACMIVLIGLFLSCSHSSGVQHNYYLASEGDDNNEGTKERPWKTIDRLNRAKLLSGDTIFFKGGQTFHGCILLDSAKHGIKNKPIVITSEGKASALILSGNGTALSLNHTGYIEILRLSFAGSGRKEGNRNDGVVVDHSREVIVDSIEIKGYQKAGLLIFSSSEIKARNVYAHENGFAGISIIGEHLKEDSKNIYIGYCFAENNPGDPEILDNHSGNGIIAGFCKNVLIEYSVSTNNGWDMPRVGNGPVGIWAYEADSVTIQHCISYRNKTSLGGADGGGFDLDGGTTRSLIQYCLSYENQGSGFGIFQYAGASSWHDNTIRYNISENDGNVSPAGANVFIWNSSRDPKQFYNCHFYNNTIYNSRGAAISYESQSEHGKFYFYNNIFVAKDGLIRGVETKDLFLGNDWYSLGGRFSCEGFKDFKTWAKEKGKEYYSNRLVGYNVDPGFKNPGNSNVVSPAELKYFDNYLLPGDSPLRNNGVDLGGLFGIQTGNKDFFQKTPSPKLIGACF